ncbi:hypothetical protein BsWGS_07505 [Bradybaena similaris]
MKCVALVLLVVFVIVVNGMSPPWERSKNEPDQPKKGEFSWAEVVPANAFSWINNQSANRLVNVSRDAKGEDGTPQKVSIIAIIFNAVVRQVQGLLLVTGISGKPHTIPKPRDLPEPNIAVYQERELEEDDSGNLTPSNSDEAVDGGKKGHHSAPQNVSLVVVAFNAIVQQIQGLLLAAQVTGNAKPGERAEPKIAYFKEREQEDDASGSATSPGGDETRGGAAKDQHSAPQKASVLALVFNAIVGQVQGLILAAEVTPGSHPPKPTRNSSNVE